MSGTRGGKNQLFLQSKDKFWKGTTTTKRRSKTSGKMITYTPNREIGIEYKELFERGFKTVNSDTYAKYMLEAVESQLNEQPDFETVFKNPAKSTAQNVDAVRATVELLLISMIAEGAIPPSDVREKFSSDLVKTINRKRKFPNKNEMPNLEELKDINGQNLKEGRTPTADLIVMKLLNKISETGARFDSIFNADHFPAIKNPKSQRQYLFTNGDEDIPSYLILEEAAGEHDGETLAKKARMSCTGSHKRRKRETCSIEEVNDHMMVDDKSIKVEDTTVELELVDRRDATKRKRLVIPITSDELATPKLIKQKMENSEKATRNSKYAKINKGLAVHGLIFSAIGAIDYFQRGDNLHGAIAVTQSLHTLGGFTGFNEIASKAAKQVLRHAAFKVARGLNMKRGFEKFSLKVEKYMEKGVGKLMGDLPGVGLAFDIYFIEQDIEALSKLNLSNPEDVKMLPLRVVDYVLDVDTTVLNLIGTFCPEAEVITEPLIIVLSIARMAIDDFYVDIMEEMDKVKWNSPLAGFQFIGALFKGIAEGLADFFTGGLRRQMETYSKQQEADNKLLSKLKDAKSYYKITGKRGEKTIDFTKGELSSFGGFITFRMCDNGMAHLEIKDFTGRHKTITKTFKIEHDVKDIVLGIGESREFLYETKTAKFWTLIKGKSYKVIKTAKLKSSSLFGTYYGNDNNNKFFAVQNQKKNKKQKDYQQCDYGKINIGFVTGHYHYNLYGRGGDDLFYLGPQMSKVTGGQGSDVYIVQSYGGNTIIDNFSDDNKRDMVIINVPFDDITCIRNNVDLDILYKNTHQIRITNWFVLGNTEYYRHVSFKSKDGIIFLAKDDLGPVRCTPIAIVKGAEKTYQTIYANNYQFSEVKQVIGSDFDDIIYGNDLNNVLDGGKGRDILTGGRGEDTYIIRAGEGCDQIENLADDYKTTTDVIIFNVPYWQIQVTIYELGIILSDSNNKRSCVYIVDWLKGDEYRHMIFTSLDHIVFKIKQSNNQYTKVPMILDYSSSVTGVKVSLQQLPVQGYIFHKGFEQVATVSDSLNSDTIIGNKQSNFLSCTKGDDTLSGMGGSDNYIIKKSCGLATIINIDKNEKVDLLLLDNKFQDLTLTKRSSDLVIYHNVYEAKVILSLWYTHSMYRHLWIRTKDGVTLRINDVQMILEPVEISKDSKECLCKGNCKKQHIKYNLRQNPWKKVTRLQLKSNSCSYTIKGNDLNNYIDPGAGNGYSFQRLRGGNGADTYVLKHGYGEFNIIDNCADDNKTDTLKFGLEISDILISFYDEYGVILTSKSRPQSLSVRIRNYFKGPECQHLQVVTTDEVTFNITKEYPFMIINTLDLSHFESANTFKLTTYQERLASQAQYVKGSSKFINTIVGTSITKEIDGGYYTDSLEGGPGDNIIKGKQGSDVIGGMGGNDVMFGGDGDDNIFGFEGNDYIYGGDGRDWINGGRGGDTICYKGDGFYKKGVYVDLSGGFGKDTDAEGDTYTSIEHVYGTIHNDTLIGSKSNNNLHGLSGNDIMIAKGGDDHLSGGDGEDRYILDDAYGIKSIDNFAKDRVKDTLSLANTYSNDVCVFLVGNNLHLQVKQSSLTSLLYQTRPLTVIVLNWKRSYQYRHLNILFKDAFWPSVLLGNVKQHIDQTTDLVRHTESQLNLTFTTGVDFILSWRPYQQSLFDEKTQIELLQYDITSPKSSKRIQLPAVAIFNGTFKIANFTRSKHYIFALLLKHCSAIIARSDSLTYLGEKRSCSAISDPYLQIKYTPQGSHAHESKASLTCATGYKFNMSDTTVYTVACVDGTWQPNHPACIQKANCSQLTQPLNGKVRSKSTFEGALATYVCNKGFQLVGSIERRCSEKGQWIGKEPTCERLKCYKLPKVEHGKLTECNENIPVYGTMQSPKQGFCVKLTCDANFVERWKLNSLTRLFVILSPANLRNKWYCEGISWKGAGDLVCVPPVRLSNTRSSWHIETGTFQEWDIANDRWKNSLSRDTNKHQLACTNTFGLTEYKEKTKIISSNSHRLRVACPKLRFGDKAVETLIQGHWERTCFTRRDNSPRLRKVYERICNEMGVPHDDPGIVTMGHGPTSHAVVCPPRSSSIGACKVKKSSIVDCNHQLHCKRRCKDYSLVFYGSVVGCTKTGKRHFEGDSCKVKCEMDGMGYIGPETVYCRNGTWTDHNGIPSFTKCY